MDREPVPPLDAEKTNKNQVVANYRTPPEIESQIARSTLLVGTRGSGKTMFLRHRRHQHDGVAVYGDLRKIATPISGELGAGGMSFEIKPSLEPVIRSKAAGLVAAWAAQQVLERLPNFPWPALLAVLPPHLRMRGELPSPDAMSSLRETIANCPLLDFGSYAGQEPLEDFLAAVSEQASRQGSGPLLLLLDRAEEVPYPALPVVMRLLDQSFPFLTVVASRPGILGADNQGSGDVPVPGDHYNVRHLGASPYSAQWEMFQESVLRAWLPRTIEAIPPQELHHLIRLCRDSARHALEVVHYSLDDGGGYTSARANSRLRLLRDTLLLAAQGSLRGMNNDLRAFVARIRKRLGSPLELPVRLRFAGDGQRRLPNIPAYFLELTKEERAVRVGLRAGFFTTEHGVPWHPFLQLEAVEIPPILVWEEGDRWSDTPPTI